MNYAELIEKALGGRTVSAAARAWGVRQPTLDRYVKAQTLPDFETTRKIIEAAGVDAKDALDAIAAEEQIRKVKQFRLQSGFVQTELLLLVATCGISGILYIMLN